jgi:signal transduction histidine kinase
LQDDTKYWPARLRERILDLQRNMTKWLADWLTPSASPINSKIKNNERLIYLPAAIVAMIGTLITLLTYTHSLNLATDKSERIFQEASQDRILVIQRDIEQALAIIQDIASFFEASETVGRREFRKFVGPALKRQAGIKALQWIPVVPGEERAEFIKEAKLSFPPFEITELTPSAVDTDTGKRSVYYPVLYVQPYKYNKEILGVDMRTDPLTASLLSSAERELELQVSHGIHLQNDQQANTIIKAAVPVSVTVPESGEIPDASPPVTRGFAVGVFHISDIIEQALERLRSGGIDLRFYQTLPSMGRDLLHTHFSRLRDSQHIGDEIPAISYTSQLSVGNQQWEVFCTPIPGKFEAELWYSWIILFGGLAFTTLLTVYLGTMVGRAQQIKSEVEERTIQLQGAVQALNREIMERKSAETELQRLNETLEHHIAFRTAEAERKAQYLEQFAYVTSHDLKAPLRAVSNLAQWIEEDLADKLNDTSRTQLALLRDRVRRMNDLIEGLLEYSRVGKISDTEQPVDTLELVHEIIDSLAPPKEFKIKIKGEMPTLYADRLQLGQVFSNLISNSLKHHGGNRGKIRITCEDIGQDYEFSVCDDGRGIAPEYHDKVFMMFQTLESTDLNTSTGIGLALVKKIVEEHGGTIRLESTVGKGVCFHFTWPKKKSSS